MQKVNTPIFAAICFGLLLTTCSENKSTEPETPPVDISTALLGTWETIEVETTCPTYAGQDTTVHLFIKESDWAKSYGIKPARTQYTADGKSKKTHYNIDGKEMDYTFGLWKPEGPDSLFVIEPNNVVRYRYEIDGSRLTLTGKVDWDYDGEQDDDYRAVLRLVARTE